MAGSSLFALIDDIATLLDDVATMTKVATKKTAGVLGDDLALNAEQVFGFHPDRELPVIWAVAKGSAKNKLILIPSALLISQFIPWLIQPALMIGGAFLCFEGFEKIMESLSKKKHSLKEAARFVEKASEHLGANMEKDRIKGAVRTDFILSAEIIVITLGTVATASFYKQLSVLFLISVLMTVGVYGLVALIVKLDDFGLYLHRTAGENEFKERTGLLFVEGAPKLLKVLSVLGTLAMFLVGGNLLAHGLHFFMEFLNTFSNVWITTLGELLLGFGVGGLIFVIYKFMGKVYGKNFR